MPRKRTARANASRLLPVSGPTLWTNLAIWLVPDHCCSSSWASIALEYPALKGFNFQGGIKIGGPLIALWFALSIYTGAFIAENVRAGIQAVSKGQTEAAACAGPAPEPDHEPCGPAAGAAGDHPAADLAVPQHHQELVAGDCGGLCDVTATLGGITLNQTGRAIECVLLLMLFYLTISLLISAVMNVYNNSMKLKER